MSVEENGELFAPEGEVEGEEQVTDGAPAASEAPEYFVGEMTADDVLSRLKTAGDLPEQFKHLESRAFGKVGTLERDLRGLQESLPTQAKVDSDKIREALKEYDADLAEILAKTLPEAFQLYSLDESALQPHFDKFNTNLAKQQAIQLVDAFHADTDEFLPDDWKKPGSQRQEDYKRWYGQQSFDTQEALRKVDGVGMVRAFNAFKEWEREQVEERKKEGAKQQARLEYSAQPGATAPPPKGEVVQTKSDAFWREFKESK